MSPDTVPSPQTPSARRRRWPRLVLLSVGAFVAGAGLGWIRGLLQAPGEPRIAVPGQRADPAGARSDPYAPRSGGPELGETAGERLPPASAQEPDAQAVADVSAAVGTDVSAPAKKAPAKAPAKKSPAKATAKNAPAEAPAKAPAKTSRARKAPAAPATADVSETTDAAAAPSAPATPVVPPVTPAETVRRAGRTASTRVRNQTGEPTPADSAAGPGAEASAGTTSGAGASTADTGPESDEQA